MFYLYGASDDLVEMRGCIEDEFCNYAEAEQGFDFKCSDGTNGKIKYNGEWKIEIENKGTSFKKLVLSVGDESEHEAIDLKEFSPYSDVMILDHIEWIDIEDSEEGEHFVAR